MLPVKPKPVRRVRSPRKVLGPKSLVLTSKLRSVVLTRIEQAANLRSLVQKTHLSMPQVRAVLARHILELKHEKAKLNDDLGKVALGSTESHGIIQKMGDLNFRLIHLEHLMDSK